MENLIAILIAGGFVSVSLLIFFALIFRGKFRSNKGLKRYFRRVDATYLSHHSRLEPEQIVKELDKTTEDIEETLEEESYYGSGINIGRLFTKIVVALITIYIGLTIFGEIESVLLEDPAFNQSIQGTMFGTILSSEGGLTNFVMLPLVLIMLGTVLIEFMGKIRGRCY